MREGLLVIVTKFCDQMYRFQIMKNIFLFITAFTIFISSLYAQSVQISISENLKISTLNSDEKRISLALGQLFVDNKSGIEKSTLIADANRSENIFLLKQIKMIEDSIKNGRRELINFYEIDPDRYLLKIASYETDRIRAIYSLIAIIADEKITFSSPIRNRTKFWKKKLIGDVRYVYKDTLNEKTAKKFNDRSIYIAKKFGLKPKKLSYYKCSNYEEVQRILGIDFDTKSAGSVQSSEAFDNTIITGVDTENFEHDVFHMYIETKFPDDANRNFTAEEGYANSIADAYYAKKSGEVISRRELVGYLREHLEKNPKADLLEMFQENPRVYFQLKNDVSEEVFDYLSVKSTIASLICDRVEREKGLDGLIKLFRSGKGEDAFFRSVGELIGLDRSNFDEKVRMLIWEFRSTELKMR